MSYVDAHIHLADPEYADRIESIMEDATKNKVACLLSNAMDYGTSIRTIALAKQYKASVLAAVGLHPWTVVNSPTSDLVRFEQLVDENKEHVQAIGEIGLDGKYTQDDEKKKLQREAFEFFLGVAEKRRLPVVVHSRLAVDEVLDELSRFNPSRALLHWYDGPVEKLELINDRGYLISVGPSVFYSKRIAAIAQKADLSMVLSETDGTVPHYGPFKGRPTQPSFVTDVVQQLAEIRSENIDMIREAVWNNFQKLIKPG